MSMIETVDDVNNLFYHEEKLHVILEVLVVN